MGEGLKLRHSTVAPAHTFRLGLGWDWGLGWGVVWDWGLGWTGVGEGLTAL